MGEKVVSLQAHRDALRREEDIATLRRYAPGITDEEIEGYFALFFPREDLAQAVAQHLQAKERAVAGALDAFIKDHSGES